MDDKPFLYHSRYFLIGFRRGVYKALFLYLTPVVILLTKAVNWVNKKTAS